MRPRAGPYHRAMCNLRARPAWPSTDTDLEARQRELAKVDVPGWQPDGAEILGGAWFLGPTGSSGERGGERAWAAAISVRGGETLSTAVVRGRTGAGYLPGSLALREGPLLEAAVEALATRPEVVLVNATGRDHPLGAGLALHLGAVCSLPTIGVTDRPLVAVALGEPGPERGDRVSLVREGVVVGAVVRTRRGARPVVVHPGWRTDVTVAVGLVLASASAARTPEPLRRARTVARLARAHDEGRLR